MCCREGGSALLSEGALQLDVRCEPAVVNTVAEEMQQRMAVGMALNALLDYGWLRSQPIRVFSPTLECSLPPCRDIYMYMSRPGFEPGTFRSQVAPCQLWYGWYKEVHVHE